MADLGRPMRAGALAVAVVLGLAGCAPPPADSFDQRGPIVLVDGPDTSFGRQVEQLVNDWNARRGYAERVTFVEMPYATDEFRAQLRAQLQDLTNADRSEYSAQCYDVVTMDVIWTAEFARAGYLVPLDGREFGLDTFLRKPVDAVTLDGKLWAIPWRTDAALLFYRKDFLDRAGAGPPATWNQLIALARTIGAEHGLEGYVGQFDQYEGLTVNAVEAIWAHGGDVLTRDGRVVIDSPEAKAGVAMLADGFASGWIPRRALEFTEEDSRIAFQQGHAVFMRNWPYAYPQLADPDSPVFGRFDVTALPGPSALGGWNLGIASCSKNRRTARDFIRHVTGELNQRHLFETAGFAPTIASVYDDPALRARFPYLDLLRRGVESSRNRPTTSYYDDVSAAIQQHVANALSNPLSADAMTESLAERLAVLSRDR